MNNVTQSDIFAAFGTDHLSAALSQLDLPPSASDLYLLLHSITPFGRFYCWNEQVNRDSICARLTRRTGKRQGLPMSVRTIQRAMKQLAEKGLAVFNRRGFKLLKVNCRPPRFQQPRQLDIFSWAKTRHFDREQPPEPLPAADYRGRKDLDLSFKDYLKTKTPDQGVCEKKLSLKPKPNLKTKGKVLSRSSNEPQTQRERRIPPPASVRLSDEQLSLLAEIGVPRQRVHRNLVRVLLAHPVSVLQQAVRYIKRRQEQVAVMNPAGYLVEAIRNRYYESVAASPPDQVESQSQSQLTPEMARWVELAERVGIYRISAVLDRGGERAFFLHGDPHAYYFDEILARHPFERLEQGIAEPCITKPEVSYTAEQAQQFIARLPGSPDPDADLRLKAHWFDDYVRDFGSSEVLPILSHWTPFQQGRVRLIQFGKLERIQFS